jgi:glycosyltransferase involved in cell wall biosynthesis
MPAAEHKIKYSVVIPVYNNASDLRQCLAALDAQTCDRDIFEVIVVDNNSTDQSAAVAEVAGVRCLHERTFQSSYAARNCGINAARGKFIAFIDSDCIAAPDWLSQIDAKSDDVTVGCFAGEILSVAPTTLTERFSEAIGLLRQRGPLSGWHFKPYAQTANAVYRRDVFQKVGLFDPTIKSGGDAILAWHMLDETDYQIRFIPEAIVYHHHRTDIPELWAQFRRYGGGKVSWALARPDYEPPILSALEKELVANFDQLVKKLEATGADPQEIIFPMLQSITRVAHYSGYLEELLKVMSHDAPRHAWPKLAIENAPMCNICGSHSFIPGPRNRMVGMRAPQCLRCGSLERHRVLYKTLSAINREKLSAWTCQTIGESMSKYLTWFREIKHIDVPSAMAQEVYNQYDLVVATNVLSRSNNNSFVDILEAAVRPLTDTGMLLLVDEVPAEDAAAWAKNYERRIARYLPNVAVRTSWMTDQVTKVKYTVTAASSDAANISKISLVIH